MTHQAGLEDRIATGRRQVAQAGPLAADLGGTLLIYAPVPLYQEDGKFHVEAQACNGLRLWAENFARLIVMMPVSANLSLIHI